MKNRLFGSLAFILALALLCGAALAEVKATGDVWMRTGPGLNYDQVAIVKEGKTLEYLGETQMDERPVAWYKVSDGKDTGWVSSKYTELTGEDAAAAEKPAEAPTEAPTEAPQAGGLLFIDTGADEVPEQESEEAVELSGYYLDDLVATANELGVISYREVQSELPYQYYNDAVVLAGYQIVEGIEVSGPGYEVFGVSVGMDVDSARACLDAAGLDFAHATANGITYEHRATEASAFADDDGHDSCINLSLDGNGMVTGIDWSTYTG